MYAYMISTYPASSELFFTWGKVAENNFWKSSLTPFCLFLNIDWSNWTQDFIHLILRNYVNWTEADSVFEKDPTESRL